MATSEFSVLRPLNLGELLDRAIRLYRQNFFKFIGIVALFQIPYTILQLLLSLSTVNKLNTWQQGLYDESYGLFTGYPFLELIGSLALTVIGFILIQGLATAVLTRAIADNYLGEEVEILQAYKKIGSSWLRVLGAFIMMGLLLIPLGIWTLVPCIGWLTGPGMILYLYVAISPFVAPVVVLEGRGVGPSLRRAWELVRRRFWWVLGFLIVLIIFAQLLSTIPNIFLNLGLNFVLGDSIDALSTGSTIQAISQSLIGLTANLIYVPLQLIAITLVYFDLRVRTEGFDLAMLANAEAPLTEITDLTSGVPFAPTSKALITTPELVHFAAVSAVAVVMYFVIAIIGLLSSVGSFLP
jgi:hypothetical protein